MGNSILISYPEAPVERVAGKNPSGSFCLGVDAVIEFDESEYLQSIVDDDTLRIVLLLCGQEAKDKLLYKDDAACLTSSIGLLKTGTSR